MPLLHKPGQEGIKLISYWDCVVWTCRDPACSELLWLPSTKLCSHLPLTWPMMVHSFRQFPVPVPKARIQLSDEDTPEDSCLLKMVLLIQKHAREIKPDGYVFLGNDTLPVLWSIGDLWIVIQITAAHWASLFSISTRCCWEFIVGGSHAAKPWAKPSPSSSLPAFLSLLGGGSGRRRLLTCCCISCQFSSVV